MVLNRLRRAPNLSHLDVILWNRSQNFGSQLPNVQAMRAKYYTRFLLRSEGPGFADEYTGVVELNHAVDQVLEPKEIEELLAENFQRNEDEVELLNWSRIH
jgi:hypothetical protein